MKSQERNASSNFFGWLSRLLGSKPNPRAIEREEIRAMLLGLRVLPVGLLEREQRNVAASHVHSSLEEAVQCMDRGLVEGGYTTGHLDLSESHIYNPGWGLAYGKIFRTGENQWECVAIYMEAKES